MTDLSIQETKEVSTIRHSDGIQYIPYKDFIVKYPMKPIPLVKSAHGIIYKSGSEYVVKVFEPKTEYSEFLTELNIYASNIHPCIMKPDAWTINNEFCYLAMKRGKNIIEEYKSGNISIEEIMSDTLSAIGFLNERGIVHGDIKPANMVFHDGKCKIIDMGLAQKVELSKETDTEGKTYEEYFMTSISYTENYRDPEYSLNQYNSIRSELYALGASYMYIVEDLIPSFGDLYFYRSNHKGVDLFVREASKLLYKKGGERRDMAAARPKISYFLDGNIPDIIVRKYIGTIFQEPPLSQNRKCDKNLNILMSWLIEVAYVANFKVESVFLCMHLMHRTFFQFLDREGGKNTNLQLYGCICMNLCLIATNQRSRERSFWKNSSVDTDPNYNSTYEKVLINILDISKGIISTLTYWDYAKSAKDLPQLLYDTINCKYDPTLIRELKEDSNKCIRMKEIFTYADLSKYKSENNTERPSAGTIVPKIQPCVLNTEPSISEIKYIWSGDEWRAKEPPDSFPVILYNRTVLNQLDLATCINIIDKLTEIAEDNLKAYSQLARFILDTIVEAGWKSVLHRVITKNPFKSFK